MGPVHNLEIYPFATLRPDPMPSILIIDDESNIRRMLGSLLRSEGYQVREAGSAREGIEAVREGEPDAVLMDLVMPGRTGLEALPELLAAAPDLPVVMMSGRASLSDAVRATKLGAFHFLEKPLTPEAVLLTLRSALDAVPGLTLEASFGKAPAGKPSAIASDRHTRLLDPDGIASQAGAVDVYRVEPATGAALLQPLQRLLVGDPGSGVDGADQGARVLAADAADAGLGADLPVVLTDGMARREKNFAAVRQN